jgi:hypothetical protein
MRAVPSGAAYVVLGRELTNTLRERPCLAGGRWHSRVCANTRHTCRRSPRARGHAWLTLIGTAYAFAMAIIAPRQSCVTYARKRKCESSGRVKGGPSVWQSTSATEECRDSESD